jgi:hypothetical protein
MLSERSLNVLRSSILLRKAGGICILLFMVAVIYAGKRYIATNLEYSVRVVLTDSVAGKAPGHYFVNGTLLLVNRSKSAISLLGIEQSCSCTSVNMSFPQQVKQGETLEMPVVISVVQPDAIKFPGIEMTLFVAGKRPVTVSIDNRNLVDLIESTESKAIDVPNFLKGAGEWSNWFRAVVVYSITLRFVTSEGAIDEKID